MMNSYFTLKNVTALSQVSALCAIILIDSPQRVCGQRPAASGQQWDAGVQLEAGEVQQRPRRAGEDKEDHQDSWEK